MGLDLVELVESAEDTFGISIPNKAAEQMTTPRKMADYIESRLAGPLELRKQGTGWSRDEIDATLRELIRERLGVDEFKVDDEFVRDMGAG